MKGAHFSFRGPAEIVAHRGFSARAPENTVVSLEMGLEAGADAVEFDLHTAADGTPLLLHDETLDRTTDGSGPVHASSLEDIGRLDAGSWFDPGFAGEPVPTLADALSAIGGRAGRIYAEVKGTRLPEDVVRIVELVHEAGVAQRTVYISMDWEALDRIRVFDDRALLGYIVEHRRRVREALDRAAADARALLDFDARILLADRSIARAALDRAIPLACWTVDDPADAARLLSMGVPRITTNRVDDLVAWKDSLPHVEADEPVVP